MMTYTLKVVEIRQETEDTCTICFKQPGLKKIKYLAGQYLTLIFRINGRRYIRPYSFSSAPGVDPTLDITVKRIPNGIVSNHIHDVVNVGDLVLLMQPMGDFTYNVEGSGQELFLWGVGSGITPLISIVKDVLVKDVSVKVSLVYGNRNHESTIFAALIQALLKSYPERFRAFHFHSQLSVTEEAPFLVQGRINQERVEEIIRTSADIDKTIHYICGPYGLKESVKAGLASQGVSDKHIFSEDFELIKNPADFENISTRQLKLQFEQQTFSLEVVKGKSVLESALEAGIELPYSCQTGNCSTCKGKLINGQMKMIGLSTDRHDLMEGEYLLCCSHPLNDDVCIEV